jgi:undecaprenyl-diphosphatase
MSAWLQVVLLGVIEGITEFLPVSSTGHLILAEQWLGVRESDAFLVIIQGGAACAVLAVFKDRVLQLLREWRQPAARDYLLKLALAFGITGVGGVLLEAAGFQLPETATPVGVALLVGGVLFVLVERVLRGRAARELVTWPVAIAVGAAQLLAAVFPGTSRSGATILIALVMGLSRPAAVEFTFLLGVPTLLAAGALKVVSRLRHPGAESLDVGLLALGVVVSAVTAFAAVAWLLRYVRSHTFEAFGWYRIIVGVAVLALAFLR